MNKEDIFYTCNDSEEQLDHTDPYDAISDYVDNCIELPIKEGDKVTVFEYARRKPSYNHHRVIEDMIERLDDEYSCDDHFTKITDEMIVAAKEFVDKILSMYTSYGCEIVGREEIDLYEWCVENNPDALKDE